MPGEAHDIDVLGSHIDRYRTSCLRRIDNEQCPMCMGDLGHARDIVYVARPIGCVRDHSQARIGTERRIEGVIVYGSILRDRYDIHIRRTLIQRTEQRAQHRVMRCGGGYGMVAIAKQPRNGGIERFSSVDSECDTLRPRSAEQVG